jgi:Tfp pilus assembly protein PilF
VKVSDGSELWGERYNRKLEDAAILEGDIAQEISERLPPRLTEEEKKTLARHDAANPEAYQFYLKGHYYAMKSTKESLGKGLEYFRKALDKDPNYALAYEGLAYYYATASEWLMPPGDAMPKAKEGALKALSLDDASAPAQNMLGVVYYEYDRDWSPAEREFQRAIELAPAYARAHQSYGRFLASMGRADQGVTESRKALDLDPLSPRGESLRGNHVPTCTTSSRSD